MVMLLRTLELKTPAADSMAAETPASPGVDGWMAGLVGTMSGTLAAMVGGAVGSGWNQSLVGSMTVWFVLLMVGCTYARSEYRKGDTPWAEFILAVLQAAAAAGLGACLSLCAHSLILLQTSLALGLATPALVARLSGPEKEP